MFYPFLRVTRGRLQCQEMFILYSLLFKNKYYPQFAKYREMSWTFRPLSPTVIPVMSIGTHRGVRVVEPSYKSVGSIISYPRVHVYLCDLHPCLRKELVTAWRGRGDRQQRSILLLCKLAGQHSDLIAMLHLLPAINIFFPQQEENTRTNNTRK